jgi:hypothetical protein
MGSLICGTRRAILSAGVRRRTSFTPASIAGLAVWLQAGPTWCFSDDAGTTPSTDGGVVAVWKDRSGNARNFVQATGAARPLLVLSGATWVVRFDGTDDALSGGDLSAAFPSAGTVGWRADITDAQDFTVFATAANDSWDNFQAGNSYPGTLRAVRVDSQPIIPGSGKRTVVQRSSASGWTRRVGGTQDISAAAGHSGGAAWTIGRCAGQVNRYAAADVAGLVAYTAAVTDAQAALIETYLASLLP